MPHASGTGVRSSAPGFHVTPHHEPCGDLRPQRLAPGTPQRDAPGDHAGWRRLRPARQDTEEGTQVRQPHLPQERHAVHVTRRLTDWRARRPRAVHESVHEGGHPFHHRRPRALERLEERLWPMGIDRRGFKSVIQAALGDPLGVPLHLQARLPPGQRPCAWSGPCGTPSRPASAAGRPAPGTRPGVAARWRPADAGLPPLRLRGTSRGDRGARRGDAGRWACVKSGFIFPILPSFSHYL